MSDVNKRLERLEARIDGAAEQIEVILTRDGECAREVWARDHPGEAYPADAFVVRFVSPMPDGPHGRA